jgi:MFS family permease
MAVVAFPGGYLADKYGRRWLITTMTFGMALSYLFFAFAPTWHFILLGITVTSLCLIYQPALFSMVQDSLPPERRGMGSSIIQLIHSTFNTPGPAIAGLLLLQFGLEWTKRNNNQHRTDTLQVFHLDIPQSRQRKLRRMESPLTIHAVATDQPNSSFVLFISNQRD